MSTEAETFGETPSPIPPAVRVPDPEKEVLIINGNRYGVAQIQVILAQVEASLAKLTLQFSRLYEQMMLSDVPNEEADGVRLKHFATNAFVNGVLVERPFNKEFVDLIEGLIARVQLETLMYRFKYGHDYVHVEDVRIMISAILHFKKLDPMYRKVPENESQVWPQIHGDLYEEACRIAAKRYEDQSDRRASAILFSQLLDNRPITIKNPAVGNIDMYAYVTNRDTSRMLWECLEGIPVQQMKNKEKGIYELSRNDLHITDALNMLTSADVRAIRTKTGLTFHNAKFANIEDWAYSNPNSRYIEVSTSRLLVSIAYFYLAMAVAFSITAAILNWGRRDSALQRIFDAAALFFIFIFGALIPIVLLTGVKGVFRVLLCGRRRLQGLESLAEFHGTSMKMLLTSLARARSVRFLKETNACYIEGPKTGTVELPLTLRECDLEDVVIIGKEYAYDMRGKWRHVEAKRGVVHFGNEIPVDMAATAVREPGKRFVGGSSNSW
ncbi:unnamed protein product [Agarophyton chilense]|eukprot:gb/GEZJ01002187.1/.p1 GENE.gb/GEZJ01002187.1/~~gb/GEZJ01002187.1/.p1  ORF type:complete len:497 (-),score=61.03 gb/GEZJ01002187.1/:2029-3519(-)